MRLRLEYTNEGPPEERISVASNPESVETATESLFDNTAVDGFRISEECPEEYNARDDSSFHIEDPPNSPTAFENPTPPVASPAERIRATVGDIAERIRATLLTVDDIRQWAEDVCGSKFDKRTVDQELRTLRQLMELAGCTFEMNGHPVRIRATKNPRSQFACLQFWRMDDGKQIFEYNGTRFPPITISKILSE